MRLKLYSAFVACAAISVSAATAAESDIIELTDDGGWCWFQDERAVIVDGKLVVGCVANGRHDADRKGDVQAVVLDLSTGKKQLVELHDQLGADDHNAPAFAALRDGRLLVVYATHGRANSFWYRLSATNDPTQWGPIHKYVPTDDSRITYSNAFRLSDENDRLINFYRGRAGSFKPSYAFSNDLGQTWQDGGVIIEVPGSFRHRPYVKYASDGASTIHIIYTNGHPRNYDNCLYHTFYHRGKLHRSDGQVIAPLAEGLSRPEQGTLVFSGNEKNVAWPCDLDLDADGRPVVVYSVQKDPHTLPPGHHESGRDHRYRYASWDGAQWRDFEMAFAGTRLYPKEDDYTGLACIDPNDVHTVYVSTDADPATGKPLISRTDGKRHYEIFKGNTSDHGKTWAWTAITANSSMDNLRPIVPKWKNDSTALMWLRGTMRTYTDYDLRPVALIEHRSSRNPTR